MRQYQLQHEDNLRDDAPPPEGDALRVTWINSKQSGELPHVDLFLNGVHYTATLGRVVLNTTVRELRESLRA